MLPTDTNSGKIVALDFQLYQGSLPYLYVVVSILSVKNLCLCQILKAYMT